MNLKKNHAPNGWETCVLPDFTRIVMGQSPPSDTYNRNGLGLPFFQGKAEFCELHPRVDKHCSRPKKVAEMGATLLSVRAPVGPTNLAQQDCCIGRGLAAIHPYGGIDPKFILFLFRSIEPDISDKGTGTTFDAINKIYIEELEFSLPPLNEQHHIVAKIEELFLELDRGIEGLKAAQEQLKVYPQALLKHAFEGKLTKQWREENKDKLETTDQLLDHIKSERGARYQQQLDDWEASIVAWETKEKPGKKPSKPRPLKTLSQLTSENYASLPNLPDGWLWERLGWLTCGVEYGTAAKSVKSGKVAVIRMGNIQNAQIDWSDLVFTSDAEEVKKYSLHKGDVLFNRTNSPELVGKTAIYRGEQSALFAGYLIRVNHNETVVDGQYLNLFLNSHVAKQHGDQVKTDGVNQSNINGDKLQNYPFPYCTNLEQRKIVRILDEKLSVIDKMELVLQEELQKSKALRQSILKKAFSGKLVAQDLSDEPASVLLERIQAEKEAREKKKKKPRKNISEKPNPKL